MKNKQLLKSLGVMLFMLGNITFNAQSSLQIGSGTNGLPDGSISLFIQDVENYYAIPAMVKITHNKKTYEAKVPNNGHFLLKGELGKYDFEFISQDHVSMKTDFTIENNDPNLNVNVFLDRVNPTPVLDSDIERENALLDGYIINFENGKPVVGAEIYANDKLVSKTNDLGYYSFTIDDYSISFDDEKYDKLIRKNITVKMAGYNSYTLKDLLITNSKITSNVVLTKGNSSNDEMYFQHILDGTDKDVEDYEKENEATIREMNQDQGTDHEIISTENNLQKVAVTCLIGSNIKVKTSSGVSLMTLESYVQSGFDSEWIMSWTNISLQVGSICYRSYGGYHINHPKASNYHICNTTSCQVYNSSVNSKAKAAAIATAGKFITSQKKEFGKPAFSEYSSETNGKSGIPQGANKDFCTQSPGNGGCCGNGKSGQLGTSSPCFSDQVCLNKIRFGHGRGMCQSGSQRWSKQSGQTVTKIINHYFNPAKLMLCGGTITSTTTTSSCDVPVNLFGSLLTSTSAKMNWDPVSGATSYIIQYKKTTDGNTSWIQVTSNLNSKIVAGLSPATAYDFAVKSVCPSGSSAYTSVNHFTTLATTIPYNNNCATSHTLAYSAACTSPLLGDLSIATASGLSKASCDNSTATTTGLVLLDVWYKYVATTTGSHKIKVAPSSGLDAVLAVYNGNSGCSTSMTEIGCSDNGGGLGGVEKVTLTLTTGDVVYARVYNYGDGIPTTTTFNICIGNPNLFKAEDAFFTSEAAEFGDITLYPNPNDGKLIYGKLNHSEEDATTIKITLIDILGKVQITKDVVVENGQFKLQLLENELHTGMYIFEGTTNNNTTYRKNMIIK